MCVATVFVAKKNSHAATVFVDKQLMVLHYEANSKMELILEYCVVSNVAAGAASKWQFQAFV